MGTSIVACGDPAPVLETSDHALDVVSGFTGIRVVRYGLCPTGPRRDTSVDFADFQGVAEPVGVAAFVADQGFGLRREQRKRQSRPIEIAGLSLRQQKDQRPATAAGKSPFLSKPAAVLCALR